MRVHQAVTLLLAALAATPAQGNGEVFTLHGSGTTNPSKCFWHIMSLFEERSQISTRLTYRAVGSSAGITEFLGVSNSHVPHNDFGSGDIPVPTAKYVALNAAVPAQTGNGKAMVHLPFAISSVSFFHNIPGVPDGEDGIKLSPCLLARIFNGETQRWSAPEVILENQHLKRVLEATSDLPIYVARRVQGSSSTASVTQVSKSGLRFPLHSAIYEEGSNGRTKHFSLNSTSTPSAQTNGDRIWSAASLTIGMQAPTLAKEAQE